MIGGLTPRSTPARFLVPRVASCRAHGDLAAVPYTYDYPRPGVTVDVVLATAGARGELRVLLIERGHPPFAGAWALPGGFVDEHEDLEVAARREMREETHLELGPMVQLGAYGTPHRDPRGHTVGVAFLAVCDLDGTAARAGDDAADCRWFDASGPPELAFDHARIVCDARARFAELAASVACFARAFGDPSAEAWLEQVRQAALEA